MNLPSTPGSRVEGNPGLTPGRDSGTLSPSEGALPTINSVEFTLALYIITRLFTAF